MSENPFKHIVAVVGAGPAGLFAARELANSGVHVVIFNRDIKPGGLAEYGIYPEKHKMKEALRAQFRQILAMDGVDYYGNIFIGNQGNLSLNQLREMGFQAILITVGAQGTKWLGIPGEDLTGVYHAKDLVYHYNRLPPYSQKKFEIGRRTTIVGAGNVMTDVARYIINTLAIDEITAVVRRGPAEIKFDRKELEFIAANLDINRFDQEIEHATPLMWSLGQNPEKAKAFIRDVYDKATPTLSKTKLMIRFLLSPTRIIGDETGHVKALEVEENTLIRDGDNIYAKGTGRHCLLEVDSVIFAIGDRVDKNLGLPMEKNEYAKNPQPRFPIADLSFEAYDPSTGQPIEDIFIAGWSRQPSTGLVGIARKDGTNGARAMIQYLETLPELENSPRETIHTFMKNLDTPVVTKSGLRRLEIMEEERAQQLGLEDYKFISNEEMLATIQQPI